MSDIFREVDEEVRRERLEKLWARYQPYIIAGVFLVLLGVGGWEGYGYWMGQRAAETGAAFEQAIALADAGKHAQSEAAFAKIAEDGTPGYRGIARMRQAAEMASRDAPAAVLAYDRIAADKSVGLVLQDLAALRAGVLLINSDSADEARKRLEPLAGAGRTFRHSAREYLALVAWRSGDVATAQRWIDTIMTDGETPDPMRTRIEMLMALIAAEPKS